MTEQNKNCKKNIWVSGLVFVLLMGATYYVIFRDNTPKTALQALKTVDLWYIVAAALLAVGVILFEGVALKIPMRMLGIKNTSFADFAGVSFAGFYFSGITPASTGGQTMELYYMYRRGVPAAAGTLTLLFNNIAYQIVIMAYGLVMLFLRLRTVQTAARGMVPFIIFGYVVSGIVLFFMFFAMSSKKFVRRAAGVIVRVLKKLRILKDPQTVLAGVNKQIDEYVRGAQLIQSRADVFVKVLMTNIAQITCNLLIPFCVYKAFGLSEFGALDIMAVQAILFMAVNFLPIPGAAGVGEKGFLTMFALFFPAGVSVPAMLLARGISFYAPLILSGAATALLHLRGVKQVSDMSSVTDNAACSQKAG